MCLYTLCVFGSFRWVVSTPSHQRKSFQKNDASSCSSSLTRSPTHPRTHHQQQRTVLARMPDGCTAFVCVLFSSTLWPARRQNPYVYCTVLWSSKAGRRFSLVAEKSLECETGALFPHGGSTVRPSFNRRAEHRRSTDAAVEGKRRRRTTRQRKTTAARVVAAV